MRIPADLTCRSHGPPAMSPVYELLTPNHLLYDLLYNPNVTLFMKKGEAQGAVVKNGLEMLLLQAFAAWEIWHK